MVLYFCVRCRKEIEEDEQCNCGVQWKYAGYGFTALSFIYLIYGLSTGSSIILSLVFLAGIGIATGYCYFGCKGSPKDRVRVIPESEKVQAQVKKPLLTNEINLQINNTNNISNNNNNTNNNNNNNTNNNNNNNNNSNNGNNCNNYYPQQQPNQQYQPNPQQYQGSPQYQQQQQQQYYQQPVPQPAPVQAPPPPYQPLSANPQPAPDILGFKTGDRERQRGPEFP